MEKETGDSWLQLKVFYWLMLAGGLTPCWTLYLAGDWPEGSKARMTDDVTSKLAMTMLEKRELPKMRQQKLMQKNAWTHRQWYSLCEQETADPGLDHSLVWKVLWKPSSAVYASAVDDSAVDDSAVDYTAKRKADETKGFCVGIDK